MNAHHSLLQTLPVNLFKALLIAILSLSGTYIQNRQLHTKAFHERSRRHHQEITGYVVSGESD